MELLHVTVGVWAPRSKTVRLLGPGNDRYCRWLAAGRSGGTPARGWAQSPLRLSHGKSR